MHYKDDHSLSILNKLIIPATRAAVIYYGVSLPPAFAKGDEVAGNNERPAASSTDLPEIFREAIGLKEPIRQIEKADFKIDAFGTELKKIIVQKVAVGAVNEMLQSDTVNRAIDLATTARKELPAACVYSALFDPNIANPFDDKIDIKEHLAREKKLVADTEKFLIVAIGTWEENLNQIKSDFEFHDKLKAIYDEKGKVLTEVYSKKIGPFIRLEQEIRDSITDYNNSLKELPTLKAEQDAQKNRVDEFNNSQLAKDYAGHQKHWPVYFAQRPAFKGHLINFQRNGMLLPIVPEGVDPVIYANEMNRNNSTNKAYNDKKSQLNNDSANINAKLKNLNDKLGQLSSHIETNKEELESKAKPFEAEIKKFNEDREIRMKMGKVISEKRGLIEDKKYEALQISNLINIAMDRLKKMDLNEARLLHARNSELINTITTKYFNGAIR